MKIKLKDFKKILAEETRQRLGTYIGPAAAYDKRSEEASTSSTQYAMVPPKRSSDSTLGAGRENLANTNLTPDYVNRLARKILDELKKLKLKKETTIDVLHKVLSMLDSEFEE